MTDGEIKKRFGPYQLPTEKTIPKFQEIQDQVMQMAHLINKLCPESREKALALTDLQNVKMWANASIALWDE